MPHVLTIVQRLVDALPINSKRTLQYIAADEVLERCAAIILDIAVYALRDVVSELVAALTQIVRLPSRQDSYLDSQVYLLRIISQCIQRVAQDVSSEGSRLQPLDNVTVCRVLTLYIKMSTITNHDLDILFGDLTVFSKPGRGARPTSQLIARMTNESSLTISMVHNEEFLRHFRNMFLYTSTVNWTATFDVIRGLLKQPYSEDEEADYNKKVHLLSYLYLDYTSMDDLLVVLFNSFNAMLKSTQSECVTSLTTSLTRWITDRPEQIQEFRVHAEAYILEGGLHFEDLLWSLADTTSSRKKSCIWPVLAILSMLYPESLRSHNEQRRSRRDSFIQTLKVAIKTKMSGACLDAYAHILCMISHLAPHEQLARAPLVSEILTSISSTIGVLRNCVEKGTFKLATYLFCALFRLNIPQSLELAMWKLDLWLDERETSLLKIQAVQCVAAIFADSTQPKESKGRERLLQVASGRIKMPFLTKSPEEDDTVENDISQYVLDMFCTAPEVILADQDHSHALDSALISCLAQTDLTTDSTAGRLILELQSPQCMRGRIFGRVLHNDSQAFFPIWCRFSVESTCGIIRKLSALEPGSIEQIIQLLDLLSKCITYRVATLQECQERLGGEDDVRGHLTVKSALEAVLLQYSCHVNFGIATRAAEACKLLVEEYDVYTAHTKSVIGDMTDNIELYISMAGETFLTAGRNAVQKKFRNSLRSARDTPALRKAWLEVFARWSRLTDQLFDARNATDLRGQEAQVEWQNYTGFLAALARIEKADIEDPVYTFISRFREVFIQSQTEFISEICAEIIGNALHISLYTPMLQEVQQMIATMKDRKGVLIVRSRNTILMEQLILICRGLFERLDSFLAFREGVNVGEIMLDLAQYLELCGQTYIRSRLRFCHLLETFATRYDLMCILDEISVRRRLCNYLGNWIALSAASSKDQAKITRDTNAACLKALAQLSIDMYFGRERMSAGRQVALDMKSFVQVILPLSSMTDEEASQFSSAALRPVLIELLSNVLAANKRIATMSFISLCYHENINVAATFSSTLGYSLKQDLGVIKSPSTEELDCQLWTLVTKDPSLMTALLDGSSTSDGPLEVVLDSFQERHCTPELFALVLTVEVAICDQETELFRRNSPTTRLFAAYVRRYGRQYVEETLRPPLAHLANRPEDYSMELDRTKLQESGATQEILTVNQNNLSSTCQEFIDAICNSLSALPKELVEILRLVGLTTAKRYPDAISRSVGSFLILRLIGPAIVQSARGSARLQRQLILVVKILTNLANKTFFKEGHLVVLNQFLNHNSAKLSGMLLRISQPGDHEQMPVVSFNMETGPNMAHKLYPFFQQKADRIKNKLIEIQLKQGYAVDTIRNMTRQIRRILCCLGEPATSDKPSYLPGSSPSRPTFSSALPVADQIFRQVGMTLTQKPLYYIEIVKFGAFQAATWVSLCSSIWQTLLALPAESIEILLDFTGFTMEPFIDSQTARDSMVELLKHDAGRRASLHVYNPNRAFANFMRQFLSDSWVERSDSIRFLDHTDALEPHFDQAVCLHMASIHGLLVRTYPHALTMMTSDNSTGLPVGLTLNSDDTMFLTTVNKFATDGIFRFRTVEQIVVKDIENVQIQHETLVIFIRNKPAVRLQTIMARREMPILSQFLTYAMEQFKVEKYDAEKIRALMMCVGFTKVASPLIMTRETGAKILINLLPTTELAKIGIISVTAATLTQLNSSELRSLHMLAYQKATLVTKITFLGELLVRLPQTAMTERRTTLPCVDIWLVDIAAAIVPENDYKDAIHRIILSLINLHSPEENSKLSQLIWSNLGIQQSLQELLYDSISSYANLFQHDSIQVTKVSQIFRIVRAPYFVKRLTDDLVREINTELLLDLPDLGSSPRWNTILVLIRILVDVTARSFEATESLPEILYAILCLINVGSLETRTLVYQLNVNVVAASACWDVLPTGHRDQLLNVLDSLQDKKMHHSYLVPLRALLESSYENIDGLVQTKNQELLIAESLSNIVKLMVDTLKYSSTSHEKETDFLGRYCKYVMDAAFRPTSIKRRAFLALGHLSAELELPSVRPLMDALQLSLSTATSQDAREALSIILSLSLTSVPEPFLLLKLALGLSTYPLSTIASAGLRLLLRCLVKIGNERTFEKMNQCLLSRHDSWLNLQKLVGLQASAGSYLGLCCFLLQAMNITRDRSAIKMVLRQLLEMQKGADDAEDRTPSGPCLLFFCALAENNQELYISDVPIPYRAELACSVTQLAHQLFALLHLKDDDLAVPTLCIFINLLASAETTEQQIKALNFLTVSATYLPRAFELVYDDLAPFLRSVLQSSNHLPLLKAAQEIIVANKDLESKRHDRALNSTNIDKDTTLRRLGFEYFTREWNRNTSSEVHKNCIGNIIIAKEN